MPLMFQIAPDKWYLTVVCRKCDEQFAFLDAPSPDDQIAGGVPQNVNSLGCPIADIKRVIRQTKCISVRHTAVAFLISETGGLKL